MAVCKRCGLKTVLTADDVEKAVEQVRVMKGIKLADDETYNKRLSICRECDKLEYGCTCMLCGCIVNVRAVMADGKCPYPKKSKWLV